MKNFLYEITENIYKKHFNNLDKIAIVLPSKRAKLFFVNYLKQIIEKPIFLPEIITLDIFFQKNIKISKADDLTLIFILHKIYKKARKINENFDDFYPWGEMLLKDFDELDKNLVDAKSIFRNIKELKDIEKTFSIDFSEEQAEALKQFLTSFDTKPYGENRKNFIEIWRVLYEIYKKFKEELFEKNIAYDGMISREFVENIENFDIKFEKIFFIGFNALNKSEEKLFEILKKRNIAEFYWDYDEFYLNNKFHQASYFLRKNIKNFKSSDNVNNFNNFKNEKNIQIIASSSDVGQAKIVHQILKDNKNFFNEKTAIILNNKNLLIPVIYAMPTEIKDINVSISYPLKSTPVYSFVNYLIELQKNISDKNEYSFYYKDILNILKHQFLKNNNYENALEIEKFIKKSKKFYFKENELQLNGLLKKIFKKNIAINEISKYILNILEEIFSELSAENIDNHIEKYENAGLLEKEFIYNTYLAIKSLQTILNKEIEKKKDKEIMEISTFLSLLKKIISSKNIDFEGEPLLGLQIMGLSETRVIDFENVILLSCNENILPKTSIGTSVIPYNLRRAFGLFTIENQDALFSYNFYRLLQRSKNIFLLYNNSVSENNSGEMSRFLFQIMYETDFKISKKVLSYDINFIENKEIKIKKNKKIIDDLIKINEKKPISATSINTYLTCKLKFYFSYLLNLKEENILSEEIDEMKFGILLHETMNFLYKDFENSKKLIYEKDIDIFLKKGNKKIENAIKKSIYKMYSIDENNDFGDLRVVKNILKEYVFYILKIDKERCPFEILGLEKNFSTKIKLENMKINIQGNIDRIDRKDNLIRIIDYKTGSFDKNKLYFKEIEEIFSSEKRNKKQIFQIFFYSYLYQIKNNRNLISPSLFYTREIFKQKLKTSIEKNKKEINDFVKNEKEEFEKYLKNILKEIFSEEKYFSQNKSIENCRICNFSKICNN